MFTNTTTLILCVCLFILGIFAGFMVISNEIERRCTCDDSSYIDGFQGDNRTVTNTNIKLQVG